MTAPTTRGPEFWKAQGRDHWAQMDRSNRLSNARLLGVEGADSLKCNDGEPHRWQPVSFVFESQLLDHEGRVRIRQPDIKAGHVYLVCLGCNSHTYVVTEWVGYFLGGPGDGTAGPDPVLSLWDDEDPDDNEPTPDVALAAAGDKEAGK